LNKPDLATSRFLFLFNGASGGVLTGYCSSARTVSNTPIEAAVVEIELLRASNSWSINRLYEHYVGEKKKQRARAQ
jgi:hypothetical protein